ncbi:PLP dependent protein, partial [Phenoliferia sp. Uapishka_3]
MSLAPATTERAADLCAAYDEIRQEVERAAGERPGGRKPRLVAVSKLKPSSDIFALYEHGVREFGENYPQELETIPNLYAIETLSTAKAATMLHKALSTQSPLRSTPLQVFLQINTSGEDAKSGLPSILSTSDAPATSEVAVLALHILSECPTLRFKGLMTIGSYIASTSTDPNPDFEALEQNRKALLEVLLSAKGNPAIPNEKIEEIERDGLEVSCGMSEDYVQAIKQGSTNVRVGSKIFGARPKRE